MCLEKLTNRKPVETGFILAYKTVPEYITREYRPQPKGTAYLGLYTNQWYQLRQWYTARNLPGNKCPLEELYPPGFHVFHTREGAERYMKGFMFSTLVILQVEIKDPVAVGMSGWHGESPATVALQRRIIREVMS